MAVGGRLTGFGPRLTRHPVIITNGGYSVTASRRVTSFGGFIRSRNCSFFPVVTTVHCSISPLLGGVRRVLSGLPPVARCRTRPTPVIAISSFSSRSIVVGGIGKVCAIRTS